MKKFEGDSGPEEEPLRIRRTSYSDQFGAEGVFDLAALNLSIRQGDSFERIPVHASISCGQPAIPFDDEILQLNTWRVLMRIQLQNAIIAEGSIRKFVLQQGEYKVSSTVSGELMTVDEIQRNLSASAGAKAEPRPSIFTAMLKWARSSNKSKSSRETSAETIEARNEIVLFAEFGKNSIIFGDKDYGDARKKDSFLANEYPFDQGETDEPLFCITPIDKSQPVRATILTAVPFHRFDAGLGDRAARLKKGVDEELAHRGEHAIEKLRAQMAFDDMKARITENQKNSDLLPARREGEFVVAIESVEIFSDQMSEFEL